MKDLKGMSLRELVHAPIRGDDEIIDEIKRRLPEIEAALELADSLISKQDAQAAHINRTIDDLAFYHACHKSEVSSDAYRAAKEVWRGDANHN